MLLRWILIFFIIINLIACERLAILSTPAKRPIPSNNKFATNAEKFFWSTLNQGRYHDIDKATKLLMIAYLQNPNDPSLAAHLGFLHIWKITERDQTIADPLMPDQIILARKYFNDAVTLSPKNPIYQGFLGDSMLVEGQIFHDEVEKVHGYFVLKRAIDMWPQFNYFTAGYPMSTLPASSKLFKEGLEWQWLTLDACIGRKINRKNPDFHPYMRRETKVGKQRACWNSWKAPYNFEGFFMNMGDMLVKSGNWQTAIAIYKNAQLASNYQSWAYRDMLEKRIQNAASNVKYFQQSHVNADRTIMFNSGHGCMACHQKA